MNIKTIYCGPVSESDINKWITLECNLSANSIILGYQGSAANDLIISCTPIFLNGHISYLKVYSGVSQYIVVHYIVV